MEIQPRFEIKYLEDALTFLKTLPEKARLKVLYNIVKAQYENDSELFKKLNDNIWEFRTRYNGIAYRLFAFWDKKSRSMVIATHGIVKKKQKTPLKEIQRAEELMKIYLKNIR